MSFKDLLDTVKEGPKTMSVIAAVFVGTWIAFDVLKIHWAPSFAIGLITGAITWIAVDEIKDRREKSKREKSRNIVAERILKEIEHEFAATLDEARAEYKGLAYKGEWDENKYTGRLHGFIQEKIHEIRLNDDSLEASRYEASIRKQFSAIEKRIRSIRKQAL